MQVTSVIGLKAAYEFGMYSFSPLANFKYVNDCKALQQLPVHILAGSRMVLFLSKCSTVYIYIYIRAVHC